MMGHTTVHLYTRQQRIRTTVQRCNTRFHALYECHCAVAVSFVPPLQSLCFSMKEPLLILATGYSCFF
jgi:hypothetical protein